MLVLFDIDGTLLLTDRAGVKSMQEAGKRVVGDRFTLAHVEFAGGLDPPIWAEGAAAAGVDPDGEVHARFRRVYAEALERRLRDDGSAHLLPGVERLVAHLREQEGVTLGLLTGNYPETGRIKLRAAGLDPDLFAVAAWGTDGPTRRDLPPVAMARYAALAGHAIAPDRVVVIGDTVHDVDCAHANGCVAVAVATGPSFDLETLAARDPELLLSDLSDAEGFLAWLATVRDA